MGVLTDFVRQVASILPEVEKPTVKPVLTNRLLWTAVAVTVYLIMAQVPLYGVASGADDQMSYTAIIFASSQGTLMTLGIGPIVTAGLILQLLKGADIIHLDFKKPDDRALFSAGTKILALIVTFAEAVAFMIGGSFGQNLPFSTAVTIIIQIMFAGLIVILLDELIQKGWGLGSGISLFIAAGVSQTIFIAVWFCAEICAVKTKMLNIEKSVRTLIYWSFTLAVRSCSWSLPTSNIKSLLSFPAASSSRIFKRAC